MTAEQARHLGVDALKALAHPLRVRIFSELSSFGPATASSLAARLGESSGATSYHLRQLERHGFVREDPERGNARDRWWERVPGPIEFAPVGGGAGERDAENLVEMEFARIENARFADYWMQREGLADAWVRAAQANSANLMLTAAELDALGDEVVEVIARYRGKPDDGSRRRVELVFRGFPVVRSSGEGPT